MSNIRSALIFCNLRSCRNQSVQAEQIALYRIITLFSGFARKYAIFPDWFVRLGPIVTFGGNVTPDEACHLEPLACGLEGMTRVNNCIENRIVVLIGAGSKSTYALQCYQATHGSGLHGIRLAHKLLSEKRLPLIGRMTYDNERFHHSQIREAIERAADRDSLKVIINWDD